MLRLALVGAGPNALYVLERLLARYHSVGDSAPRLAIHVFDKTGRFGSGIHDPSQPSTSLLNNRISDTALASCDKNSLQYGIDPNYARTIEEWLGGHNSNNARYTPITQEQSYVGRHIFGQALEDTFIKYCKALNSIGNNVNCRPDEVISINLIADGVFLLRSRRRSVSQSLEFDFVVLATGHDQSKIDPSRCEAVWDEFAQDNPQYIYLHSAYPLSALDKVCVPPGASVACLGMGLTAIDVILHLTEGRGGKFNEVPTGGVVYEPSGQEPATIYPFSTSGVPLCSKPPTETDLNSDNYDCNIFTDGNIAALRRSRVASADCLSDRNPLDFEADVLPLMIVETALVYYKTLFGDAHSGLLEDAAQRHIAAFIDAVWSRRPTWEWLIEPIQSLAAELQTASAALFNKTLSERLWTSNVGRQAGRANVVLFDWVRFCDPLYDCTPDETGWHTAVLAWLRSERAAATRGSLGDPRKAASRAVWLQQLPRLRRVIEAGGLTAESERRYLDKWRGIIQRLSGTPFHVFQRLIALAEAGVVDFRAARACRVSLESLSGFRLHADGVPTNITPTAEVMINARIHRFSVGRVASPLYANLEAAGLVRAWRALEPGANGDGIDVDSQTLMVLSRLGEPVVGLAAIGSPIEGKLVARITAASSDPNDIVFQDADRIASQIFAHAGRLASGRDISRLSRELI